MSKLQQENKMIARTTGQPELSRSEGSMSMNKAVMFHHHDGSISDKRHSEQYLFHSDDYIALFVSCVDIPVSFGSLF